MGLPYPVYSIIYENEILFLKMKSDKAWLTMRPISETSFYHVSSFNHFEVTFLPDEDGQVDQFQYVENGSVFTFNRLQDDNPEPPTPTPPVPTAVPTATLAATRCK
jgi:hypothetical protein